MDLQAYSWACGSSIRALSSTAHPSNDEGEDFRPQAPGLLSLWASAVHVAAAQGEVEDLESELGPAASLVMDVPMPPRASDSEEDMEDMEKENLSENKITTELSKTLQTSESENLQIETAETHTSLVCLPETKEAPNGSEKDVGFLALLSAWSDDAPASRLLEEARQVPAKTLDKSSKRLERGRHEKAPSKNFLEELRLKFPQSRASSPPAESKRWKTQDFHIYLGTDGAIKPRAEPWPAVEEEMAKEMQSTSRASPLLAELRMQLAADKVTKAPSDYSAFSKHLLALGDPRQLPVAEVIPVPRMRRATEDLKMPICVEKQRGWKMRSWGIAYWSYECGEAACECFRQYPPSTGSSDPKTQLPVRARVDELGKYINILQDMDPQCTEDHYLAYPRYIASWSPFGSIPKAKRLFEQDLNARRKQWAPIGLKDLSPKWFDLCCLAVGLQIGQELAEQDTLQFGPASALTRLHVENSAAHVWHAQIQGRRMFVLFSPQETEKLGGKCCNGAMTRESRDWVSPVDIFSGQKHGRFSESQAHVVVLEPGETLIVPAGWWQCSVALEPFTTMSRRFWNRSNRLGICDEIARLSALREPGPNQRMRLDSQLPLLREQIQEDDLSSGED